MESRTVKILKRLPTAIAKTRKLVTHYQTSRAFKVFETFCYLKAITDSGKLQWYGYDSYHEFICALAYQCNISVNSMYTRIKWLLEWELITQDKHKNITLESWQTVSKEYRVTSADFYEITIEEKGPRLEYILKSLVLQENISQQRHAFQKKVSNNRLKDTLEGLAPKGTKTLTQLSEFIIQAQKESFVTRSDSYDFFHSLRADFSCSIKNIARQFKFQDTRSCVYLKKVLTLKGLVKFEHRKIESSKCTRKARNVFNGDRVPANYVWDPIKKLRVWVMPDAVTFNPSTLLAL